MLVINCLGNYFDSEMSGVDLFVFFIGASLVLSLLSWYYGKIPNKSSIVSLNSESSVFYDLRDVFLQEKSNIKDYHLVNENKSVWVKLVVFVLVLLVATTPLFELFGIQTIY